MSTQLLQDFLKVHQDALNKKYPSQGSMYIYDAFVINIKNISEDFIEEILKRLKSYPNYCTEEEDRKNLEKNSFIKKISSDTEFSQLISKWFDDTPSVPLQDILKKIFESEYEIYSFEIAPSWIETPEYPWFMNMAWGMTYNIFIITDRTHSILIKFGNEIT